jgi:hypothetical protein
MEPTGHAVSGVPLSFEDEMTGNHDDDWWTDEYGPSWVDKMVAADPSILVEIDEWGRTRRVCRWLAVGTTPSRARSRSAVSQPAPRQP